MSDSEKGERERYALKDDVMGIAEGATTTFTTIIHCSKDCELRQVYSSPHSQFLLFMISVASALLLKLKT